MSGDSDIKATQKIDKMKGGKAAAVNVEQARDVYVTAGEPRPPLWVNVPALRPHYHGRDELEQQLAQRLAAGEPVALAAHGLPGAGKSTLAARLAHRRDLLDHFRDGVLWAGLGPQGDVARLLGQWAEALDADVATLPGIDERRRAVQRLIGQRRLLLVVDDAWEADDAHLLRCGGPRCCYLLTTRHRDVARAFAGRDNAVAVPPLEQEPAVALLRELAPEAYEADPGAVAQLARTTGRLPLALELVGGYLGAEERALWPDLAREALAEMADPARRLQLATRRLGAAADGRVTLRETIALSVDSLPDEARRAFDALGAFAPRPETFTRAAAEAVAETGPRTLALLAARNLLEKVLPEKAPPDTDKDGELALHQVLADVAAQQTPDAALTRHRAHYLALAEEDRGDWRRIEAAYGQIGRAWEQAPEDESLLDLVWALRVFQERRGLWMDYRRSAQRGLDVARAAGRRKDEGTLLNNIGHVHDRQGRYEEALDHYERALAIREEVGDRPGLGTTLNNIGKVYRNLGRYEEALEYYERALAIREEVGDRPGLGTTLNNIGLVHHRQGRYEEALEHYERALAIREEVGDRPGLGVTLSNIAGIHYSQGRYEEALEHYEQALAIGEEVGDRPGVGQTLNNIGAVYRSQGRYEAALEHYERALAILEEVGDRYGESVTRYNIAAIDREQGRLRAAAAHLRRVVELREQMQHPDLESDRATLAEVEAELAAQEEA